MERILLDADAPLAPAPPQPTLECGPPAPADPAGYGGFQGIVPEPPALRQRSRSKTTTSRSSVDEEALMNMILEDDELS